MKQTLVIVLVVVLVLVLGSIYFLFGGKWIEGKVTDTTGNPIPYASITIANVTQKCDKEGNFRVWISPDKPTGIMASHQCFKPFEKLLKDVDLSKPITIQLQNNGYDDMLVTCRSYLSGLTNFALKLERTVYEDLDKDNKDTTLYRSDRGESLYLTCNGANYYADQYSNNVDGIISKRETIVVGSDPAKPGKIVIPTTGVPPMVYYKDLKMKNWIYFRSIDEPLFEIPLPEPNAKLSMETLFSYGGTSRFEFIPDAGMAADGKSLTGCKVGWSPESGLRGKMVTFLFRESGPWYKIAFEDNGENPASTPALFSYTLLTDHDNFTIEIPKDATPKKKESKK